MIPRLIEKVVKSALLGSGKIVLLLGARQVGKTTILNNLASSLQDQNQTMIYLNCDLEEDRRRLDTTSLTILRDLVKNFDFLLVDEAQRLTNSGLTLKIIHDQLPKTKVLATGSSSLNLKNKLSDPLTGRYLDFTLYPFSLVETSGKQNLDYFLPSVMNFGLYPEIYLDQNPAAKATKLIKIIDSYLFKDILEFQKVRQPQILKDLTKALAYQIGSEVNENELASRLKIDRKTVINYFDLLEKTFVIVRVFPFSQNPRREIGRKYKIYFVDLGIRNALIGDFNVPTIRADIGKLWENFLVIERLKKIANAGEIINVNFWRSYGGAEIDYLERKPMEKLPRAFEFKFGQGKMSKGARSFEEKYNIKPQLVNQENFSDFIS
ncbi:ATP-binding protein [Candidatus Gottesmanbacteria bacterium]|nr:ATP-binding protein [Candidatus Gottesmanbacteria bacterium]